MSFQMNEHLQAFKPAVGFHIDTKLEKTFDAGEWVGVYRGKITNYSYLVGQYAFKPEELKNLTPSSEISFSLPRYDKDDLEEYCKQKGTTVGQFLMDYVRETLNKRR